MDTHPIACSLSRDALRSRREVIDALCRSALVGRDDLAGGVRLRFRDGPGVERRIRELAALEAECCPFLDFAVGRLEGELRLDISGPESARPVIEDSFAWEGAQRTSKIR